MERPRCALLRAKEFADKCGVTVRTREVDLERFGQILALRFIGLGLDQIKTLLDGPTQPLAEAFQLQRKKPNSDEGGAFISKASASL